MKKLLYLPIEIKHREFLAKLLLSFFAVKKNFYVIIGDKEGIERSTRYFGEGIYFDKSISLNKTQKFKNLREKNIKIVCQDEEAGFNKVNKNHINNFFSKRVTPENLRLIEKFFCWGRFDYTYLKKKYKKFEKKFSLTGSARFDLWNKKFISNIFKNEINEIKHEFGNFILFPTSFGITTLEEKNKRINQGKFLNYITSNNELKYKITEYNNLYSNFLEFVKLIKYISKHLPNQNIIIRPHFAENKNDWKKCFKGFKNVKIINDHDISLWILASKLVIHNGSTTGIQSYYMKKSVLIYSTKFSKKIENTFPNKFGTILGNKKKILDYIKNESEEIFNKKIDRIHLSNTYLSQQIIKKIDSIKVKKNNKYKSLIPLWFNVFFVTRKLRNLFSSKSLNSLNENKTNIRSKNEKIPGGISKIEISEFLKKLEIYFNVPKTIKLRYLGPNCFLIYKR